MDSRLPHPPFAQSLLLSAPGVLATGSAVAAERSLFTPIGLCRLADPRAASADTTYSGKLRTVPLQLVSLECSQLRGVIGSISPPVGVITIFIWASRAPLKSVIWWDLRKLRNFRGFPHIRSLAVDYHVERHYKCLYGAQYNQHVFFSPSIAIHKPPEYSSKPTFNKKEDILLNETDTLLMPHKPHLFAEE